MKTTIPKGKQNVLTFLLHCRNCKPIRLEQIISWVNLLIVLALSLSLSVFSFFFHYCPLFVLIKDDENRRELINISMLNTNNTLVLLHFSFYHNVTTLYVLFLEFLIVLFLLILRDFETY